MKSIAIYADGADLATMARLEPQVAGYTTNPSLMRKAGIKDYATFAREVLAVAKGKPVSFEVLADEHHEMCRQARLIASWGENVVVKIPITNTKGLSTEWVIENLTIEGIKVNVTAIFTGLQAKKAASAIRAPGSILSVFAGRIADAGVDPHRTMIDAMMVARRVKAQSLWASARQVYNVIDAERAGVDIITLSPDLIDKMSGFGRDLDEYSLETVRQFARDAKGIVL